jgi:pyruvate kinase
MLRGGKEIELASGQEVIIYAAGDEYDKWEGYSDPVTGGWVGGA